MALKAVLDTLDGLSDVVKAEYKQGEDKKFYLDVDGVDNMPAVIGLKKAKQELLDEKKKSDDKLRAFGDYTPEKIEDLKKAAAAADGKDITRLKAEFEEKLTATSRNAQAEIEKATKAADAAVAAAEDYFISSEISRVLGDADVKGVPALLEPKMREAIRPKRVEENGKIKFVAEVVKDGSVRIKDSAGNPFGVKDLALELKQDPTYGRAFEPSGKTGSGATQSQQLGGSKTVSRDDAMALGANLEGIVKGEVTVV